MGQAEVAELGLEVAGGVVNIGEVANESLCTFERRLLRLAVRRSTMSAGANEGGEQCRRSLPSLSVSDAAPKAFPTLAERRDELAPLRLAEMSETFEKFVEFALDVVLLVPFS